MSGVTLTDGSGLTRRNRLTARALATVLQKVQAEDWYPAFYASLPVAGNTGRLVGGTLRNRMNGTSAANNARAKTGTLTGVTALSGYVTGRDGRRYVYSMVSNYSGLDPASGRERLRRRAGALERLATASRVRRARLGATQEEVS